MKSVYSIDYQIDDNYKLSTIDFGSKDSMERTWNTFVHQNYHLVIAFKGLDVIRQYSSTTAVLMQDTCVVLDAI